MQVIPILQIFTTIGMLCKTMNLRTYLEMCKYRYYRFKISNDVIGIYNYTIKLLHF
jgi:hypothetical protein